MSTRRILCVQRGPGLQQLTNTLKSDGYEVLPAANGAAALDLLSSEAVDGVVLGFDIASSDWRTLRNRILHQHPDMPMLLFSDLDDIKRMPLDVFRACVEDTPESAFGFARSAN